jgi:predicted transcriptional regulator
MKTVTLDVRSPNETMADFTSVWNSGKAAQSARISFATPELLWKVLTAKRWELLKVLCGAGPISIREAARRVDRDVKAVHGDVTALLLAGILDRSDDGRIEFPFEAIKVEFLLEAADDRASSTEPEVLGVGRS